MSYVYALRRCLSGVARDLYRGFFAEVNLWRFRWRISRKMHAMRAQRRGGANQ